MATYDKISETLNVENSMAITPTVVVDNELGNTGDDVNLDADYIKTRSNLLTLSEKLNSLIDNAIMVAEASETPRAYEVAGGLLNNAIDVNMAILNLTEKKKKIKNMEVASQNTKNVTNNTLFVGSTAELLKHISKVK